MGMNESRYRYRNPRPHFSILQAVITRLKRARGGSSRDECTTEKPTTSWIQRALLRLFGPPLVLILIVLSIFALPYFRSKSNST